MVWQTTGNEEAGTSDLEPLAGLAGGQPGIKRRGGDPGWAPSGVGTGRRDLGWVPAGGCDAGDCGVGSGDCGSGDCGSGP